MKKLDKSNRAAFAFGIIASETIFLFGVSIFLIYKSLTATNTSDSKALIGEIFYALAGSLVLLFLAISLKKSKRYSFAPIILINLISIGVAKFMYDAGLLFGAVPLAIVGLIQIILVVSLAAE